MGAQGSIQIYDPIDCQVNDWQNTGACNNGLQNQIRQITMMPQFNGKECPILSQQINCPIDCVVSNWQNSGPCSATCGTGTQNQIRTITTQPLNGGITCPPLTQQINCSGPPCIVDCEVSNLLQIIVVDYQ